MNRWTWFLYAGRKALSRSQWNRWAALVVESLAILSVLVGFVLLITTVLARFLPYQETISKPSGIEIAVRVLAAVVLIGIGVYWMVAAIWRASAAKTPTPPTPPTRRSQGSDVVLINQLESDASKFPTVPARTREVSRGSELAFRLHSPNPEMFWMLGAAVASLVSLGLLSGLALWSYRTYSEGRIDWWATVAAALCLPVVGWSVYRFFRRFVHVVGFGPTRLEVSSYPFLPGQTVQMALRQPGRMRFHLLEVVLLCEETATFSQGTNVRTESRKVVEERLFRQRGVSADDGFHCEFPLTLPTDAMHSFVSTSNRIQWKIVVSASVRGWPRFERTFPIVVLPAST